MIRLLLTLSLSLLVVAPAAAQGTGETSPFTFGQIYLPDPLLPAEAGVNPAMLDLSIRYQSGPHFSLDYGQLALRSGFTPNWVVASLITRLGKKSALRLSGYRLSSNRGWYQNIRPLMAEFDGEGIEIAYARQISRELTLGLAIVPYNAIETRHYQGNRLKAKGTLKTDLQGRLGLLWQKGSWKLGAVYDHESMESGHCQRMALLGLSHRFQTGTTVYLSRLEYRLDGNGINFQSHATNFGLNQELGKGWIVTVDHTGKGISLALVKLLKGGSVYAVIGQRSFSHTEGIFGERGSFTGFGGSWSF